MQTDNSLCSSVKNGQLKSIDLSHKQAIQLLGEKTFFKNLLWNDIPNFAVITGKNGGGKSRLLSYVSTVLKQNHPELYVLYESDLNKSSIVSHIKYSPSGFCNKNFKRELLEALIKYYLTGDKLSNCLTGLKINDKLKQIIKNDKTLNLITKEGKKKLNKLIDSYIHDYHQDNHDLTKPIETLTFIFKLFDENFQNLQKKYKKMKYLKDLKDFYCKCHPEKEEKTFFTQFDDPMFQKELASEYIRCELHQEPPWEEFNKLLNEENISYNIFWRKSGDISEKEIVFRRKEKNNIDLSFYELSAGEKCVVEMISRLFYFQCFYANGEKNKDLKKVNIMLLDEPDIHLDTVLCKLINKIIFKYFVEKHKIQVIMTTHNSETVVQVPENSLFRIENDAINISTVETIKQINYNIQDLLQRNDANSCKTTIELYNGKTIVPPNTKCIYVENEDIAYFYTVVYKKYFLSKYITPSTAKLIFLSARVKDIKTENLDEIAEASNQLLVNYPTNVNVMRINCFLQKLKSKYDNNKVTKNTFFKGFEVNCNDGTVTSCAESQLFHNSSSKWNLKNEAKLAKSTKMIYNIECYLSMPLNLLYAIKEDSQHGLYQEVFDVYQELEVSLINTEKDKLTSVLKNATRLVLNVLHKTLLKRMQEFPDKIEILKELSRGLSSKNESFFLMLAIGIEVEYPKIFINGISCNSEKCCFILLEAISYVLYGKFENKIPEPFKNALCKMPIDLFPKTLLDEFNNIGSSCNYH